ncbi:hypothetical protein C1645_831088 [Glomus cerebriforme]|uniref:Jacalin-type lectin domain-containing protein n=1 Tax=Glomus cerebriforme TaxID=658196 RepID=A0A397SG95_9GLOM|nr:hypothetical protein C1645_831088 [Glomus cerebriforme]
MSSNWEIGLIRATIQQNKLMTIIVKSVSPKYGGDNNGNDYNDYNDIIAAYGGATNIKSINIKSIEIQAGSIVDSLQLTYNIVTLDGTSNNYQGNKYGGSGGVKRDIIFADGEQLTRISGRYGKYSNCTKIGYLEFRTSKNTYRFGNDSGDTGKIAFTFPVGVIYGSGSRHLDNIGSIEIEGTIQPTTSLLSFMSIIIKNISPKYGGNRGIDYNDFNDIITAYGGNNNIKSINVKKIEIRANDIVDSLQFTYNIVTLYGASHDYQGNKYGGNGGTKQDLNLTVDEQLTRIRVDMFQTSQNTYCFGGKGNAEDITFTLPVGVIYGSSGHYLESIGSVEITEAIKQ